VVSIPKIIGIISCSAVLCLGLSNAAQARMSTGPCSDRIGGQPSLLKCDEGTLRGIETIKGEVLRVEGDNYVVERFNGKEVQLHIDQTTKMSGRIGRGDRIEAKMGEVDHQKHALSLRRLE
jgi:translation initiation factor IF-1